MLDLTTEQNTHKDWWINFYIKISNFYEVKYKQPEILDLSVFVLVWAVLTGSLGCMNSVFSLFRCLG